MPEFFEPRLVCALPCFSAELRPRAHPAEDLAILNGFFPFGEKFDVKGLIPRLAFVPVPCGTVSFSIQFLCLIQLPAGTHKIKIQVEMPRLKSNRTPQAMKINSIPTAAELPAEIGPKDFVFNEAEIVADGQATLGTILAPMEITAKLPSIIRLSFFENETKFGSTIFPVEFIRTDIPLSDVQFLSRQ